MESNQTPIIQNEEQTTPVIEVATKKTLKDIISIKTLLQESWTFVKENTTLVLWYLLTLSVMTALSAEVVIDAVFVQGTAMAPLWLIGFFVTIVFLILNGWAMMHAVSQDSATEVSYKTSFDWAAKNFFPLLWTGLLVSLAIMLGYVLLIIPGIILSVYLYFALYAQIIDGTVGTKALKKSYQVVKGHWFDTAWKLIILGFYLLLLYIVVAIIEAIITAILEIFGESIYSALFSEVLLNGVAMGVIGVMSMFVLARVYKALKLLV